jgi:hypothetical protein
MAGSGNVSVKAKKGRRWRPFVLGQLAVAVLELYVPTFFHFKTVVYGV